METEKSRLEKENALLQAEVEEMRRKQKEAEPQDEMTRRGLARTRPVYQFKITLEGIEPPIWRRILIGEQATFWSLHVAIQDGLGR